MPAIGFAAPLSGPQSIVALPMLRAVQLAVEHYSAAYPSHAPVSLAAEDDGACAEGARRAARRLVDRQDVLGVVGHKNSEPCEAAGELYAAVGLPQITPSATNSALAERGWPTFFRVCADNARQAAVACEAIAALGVHRVAVVHDATAYGRPLAEAAACGLAARGIEVVATAELPAGAANDAAVEAVVDTLVASGVRLVYAGLTEVEGALLLHALRRRGISLTYVGAEGGPASALVALAGTAADGSLHTYAGTDPSGGPSPSTFAALYEARFGERPGGFTAECYDAAGLLLRAFSDDTPSRSSVLRALRSPGPFQGVTGTIAFDERGERREAAVSLWRAREARMQAITLKDVADWRLAWSD
jgi:branched-chain amino acid transport system substrate-binding protein